MTRSPSPIVHRFWFWVHLGLLMIAPLVAAAGCSDDEAGDCWSSERRLAVTTGESRVEFETSVCLFRQNLHLTLEIVNNGNTSVFFWDPDSPIFGGKNNQIDVTFGLVPFPDHALPMLREIAPHSKFSRSEETTSTIPFEDVSFISVKFFYMIVDDVSEFERMSASLDHDEYYYYVEVDHEFGRFYLRRLIPQEVRFAKTPFPARQ